MDEHRLKCFVAVYEQGSVSAAATRLHMTQPPLSILLRKLEPAGEGELMLRLEALKKRLAAEGLFASILGFSAVVLAMINVVGGYLVTDRMLGMFKKKDKGPQAK